MSSELTEKGFFQIGKKVKIGENVHLGRYTVVGDDCVIGDNVYISSNCVLCRGTIVEDGVFIGPGVLLFNDNYMKHGREIKPPKLKRKCRIGGGSTICQGVIVGENAMVGIGSLVVMNVPDEEMWFGRPAKRVRKVPKEELR